MSDAPKAESISEPTFVLPSAPTRPRRHRATADIVFVLDASDSMEPMLEGVKESIGKLADTLRFDLSRDWDFRLDFLAHACGNDRFLCRSVRMDVSVLDALYLGNPVLASRCFTQSVIEFKQALAEVRTGGDEMPLAALDIALDYPWRDARECRRAVVLLTDEAVETGINVAAQRAHVPELVNKIHAKRVKLFIVAPESEIFYRLAMADGCEYEVVPDSGNGLAGLDFSKLMESVGKSVSASQSVLPGDDAPLPLFGQERWRATGDETSILGVDRKVS
ncbi:MAG: VWA domain-containing protein [Puniceicoccales bacterium]|jgi:hypothetical protein|nr:VWA domain-containing protein [Puniceicoccales bacterium]